MCGSFGSAVGLGQAGGEHVGHALSLMIVAAVQNREKVDVANDRRLATQRWFVGRFDELALVESRPSRCRAAASDKRYLERRVPGRIRVPDWVSGGANAPPDESAAVPTGSDQRV